MNHKPYIPRRLWPQLGRIDVALLVRLLILVLVLFAVLPAPVSQTTAPSEDCIETQAGPLTSGQSLTHQLTRKQKHVFQLTLAPKQYVHIVIEQRGIDVVVRLRDSNRNLLIERDSPNAKFGPEAVSVVAGEAATYYLEICADKNQPAGEYVLKVEGPRESVAADNDRVTAEHLSMEARMSLSAAKQTKESLTLAIDQLNKTLPIWRELGDWREEGYALCGIGEAYWYLGDFAKAKDELDKAFVRLGGEEPDLSGQAFVQNQIGAAYRDLDDPRKALDFYSRALELRRTLGDQWGQAQLHNNIGVVYLRVGEPRLAISSFESAFPLWRQLDAREMELNTFNNFQTANSDVGNLTAAFQAFQELLDACHESNGPCFLEPFALNSRGVIYDTWGQPNEALTDYYAALKLFRDMKVRKDEEVRVLNNIGLVFAGMGDAQAALDQFWEALAVPYRSLDDITHSNLGYAQALLRNYTEALRELNEAERLATNARFRGYTLTRIGSIHVARSEFDQALAAYNKALEIQNGIDDRRGQAITLDKIGELYNLMNQPAQAVNNYEMALERWRGVRDEQGEALSLYGLASVASKQNKLQEARDKIVAAIDKVESVRTRTTSHRFRLSYFASRQDLYELEIDTRMRIYEANRSRTELEAALYASERARARNLLDVLTESHADIRQGVDPQLLDRERTQSKQLTDKLSSFQELLIKKPTEQQKSIAEKEIKTLTRLLDQTQAEIRQHSPRYAALTQPQPLKLAQIQELLDDDTLLLEYALGKERSYLWVISRTDVMPYTLTGQEQIQQSVDSFREALTAQESKQPGEDTKKYVARLRNGPANYRKTALALTQMVLEPASTAISKKRLVIVADGPLQYVPFGALLMPGEVKVRMSTPIPLIAKHEIDYQPSASALSLVRATERPAATKTLAVFADPVFEVTDERVRAARMQPKSEAPALTLELKHALRDAGDTGSVDSAFRLDRLPYSRTEADAIVAATAPGSSLKAIDFDANRARFLSQDLKQFRMVHLATHGILNTKHPELSGIVFSLVDERGRPEDGFLRLGDIYNLNLPIEMVVLSACRTGVGEPVKGEGLMGLTRGFMYAGAARVVASLWNVSDRATATLMKRFYNYMLQKKMPPAAALRRAQLDMLEAGQDPFYWAGFVLQGEWN
jgi:CHAT domain-containing protein/tetratricopeptide (TPR) repeat protein